MVKVLTWFPRQFEGEAMNDYKFAGLPNIEMFHLKL